MLCSMAEDALWLVCVKQQLQKVLPETLQCLADRPTHVCCAALGRSPALPRTQARERRPAAASLAGLDLGRVPLKQIVALASRKNSEAERARRDDLRRKARARDVVASKASVL